MIIGVDFDGTIVEHDYPEIGDPVPGAFYWMKQWQEAGAKLILWTMRSDDTLDAAVGYCAAFDINFWGVNENPDQHKWTNSPKQYCHVYVDDAAFGCPLINGARSARKMVDWSIVGPAVLEMIKKS